MTTDCAHCLLRRQPLFDKMSDDEVAFMRRFKSDEITVRPRTEILSQGQSSQELYTVLSGFGLRTFLLEDGRRQVINFIFPGDLVGLQAGLTGNSRYSVTATTEMTLCVFSRKGLWDLFAGQPSRAFDLTWIAAMEEHFLGETIATLGQLDATERVAWALVRLWRRLLALGLERGGSVPFAFRQHDLADALGLSVVHTNRVIGNLRRQGLVDLNRGRLTMHDHIALSNMAGFPSESDKLRPIL